MRTVEDGCREVGGVRGVWRRGDCRRDGGESAEVLLFLGRARGRRNGRGGALTARGRCRRQRSFGRRSWEGGGATGAKSESREEGVGEEKRNNSVLVGTGRREVKRREPGENRARLGRHSPQHQTGSRLALDLAQSFCYPIASELSSHHRVELPTLQAL